MGINLPSFLGYSVASQAVRVNQDALSVVNNNITNANTPGYSNEEIDLASAAPLGSDSAGSGGLYGGIGQGVTVSDVTRAHNQFLDGQIQGQTSLSNFSTTINSTLQQVQSLVADSSGTGVNDALSNFSAAAQALSTQPDDLTVRASFMQAAQDALNTFQQTGQQLESLRSGIVGDPTVPGSITSSQTGATVTSINSQLKAIASLNQQILQAQNSGATPNSLLDNRDAALQTLSASMNVSVSYNSNNQAIIKLGSNTLVNGGTVVNSLQVTANTVDPDNTPTLVQIVPSAGGTATTVNSDITGGTLGGYLAVGGNAAGQTTIRSELGQLDSVFDQIATQLNTLQGAGRNLDTVNNNVPTASTTTPPVVGNDVIFVPPASGSTGLDMMNYKINTNLVQNPGLLSAAINDTTVTGGFAGASDNRNAQLMANVFSSANGSALQGLSPQSYLNTQIASLGASVASAQTSDSNNSAILTQLTTQQTNLQGVNLDSQLVDMLKYQRSYEASAKVMSTMDAVMETIIQSVQ